MCKGVKHEDHTIDYLVYSYNWLNCQYINECNNKYYYNLLKHFACYLVAPNYLESYLCYTYKKNLNYNKAIPYTKRIEKINKLYDENNTIVYWTARGTKTGIQWFQKTLEQLNQWNCKFHELRMGKPAFDMFIDDKVINSDNYFNSI